MNFLLEICYPTTAQSEPKAATTKSASNTNETDGMATVKDELKCLELARCGPTTI
jgi:hypothetical protein